MLHSRPVWARKVAPGGGHNLPRQQVFQQPSQHVRIPRHASITQCSATAATVSESAVTSRKPVSLIRKIRESLLSGEKTAVEITEAYLSKLREREPYLRSFLHVSERALQEAQELDKRIAEGAEVGALAGVPIGVKDNLCTRDMPSTGGSRILRGYCPPFDATAVAKLRAAGAVIVGKTNMDEFGMGSSTEGSAYQVLELISFHLGF